MYDVYGTIICKNLRLITPTNFIGQIIVADTLDVGKRLTIDCGTGDAVTNNIHSIVSMGDPKYSDMYIEGSLKARVITIWNYATIEDRSTK